MSKTFTHSDIISLLQKYYERNDGYLSLQIYNENHYRPSETTIRKKFGSWNKALQAAGLPINREGKQQFSDQELLSFLIKASGEQGKLTAKSYKRHYSSPDIDAYISRFGSWNAALQRAGIPENRVLVSDEQILISLSSFIKEHPNQTTSEHYKNCRIQPSHHTIIRRFGTWKKALLLAKKKHL